MTQDPKLIELVARAIRAADHPIEPRSYEQYAAAALTAINDSGEWWVAPAEATGAMTEEVRGMFMSPQPKYAARTCFGRMRTAYLSRTEETK